MLRSQRVDFLPHRFDIHSALGPTARTALRQFADFVANRPGKGESAENYRDDIAMKAVALVFQHIAAAINIRRLAPFDPGCP